ncbi:hypothetical protein [Chitinivorax sp. B]|uniref:hypothetical protein n=1 Tax=Chitinivorax sp. B TaxID=2502235 RepID=UPI0010F7F8DB|nr:hypothetical protein [Chitinivorax sp. B]
MSGEFDHIVWRSPTGEILSCVEKIKVMRENLEELKQMAQDAMEDALLMGGDEHQVRQVLHELVDSLINPYPDAE